MKPDRRLSAVFESMLDVADPAGGAPTIRPTACPDRTADGIHLTTVRGITVHVAIGAQLDALLAAAERDGYHLTGAGYRSHERQIELRREHCGPSQYAIYEMPSSQCSPPTARPGNSMHEQGLAIDFSCSGALIESRSNPCFTRLSAHAPRYGLHNLPSEPWHFSLTGT
jgi:LAS superfamily LD-carboxypeptidase LdcB